MKKLASAFVLFLGLSAGGAHADDVQVERATVRATAPGQQTAMLDMQITSRQAGRLVAVTSPAARSVELHRMSHQDGMMTMREVEAIRLPAGQAVALGEAGFHLMLMDIKAPISEGDSVPFVATVKLDNGRTVKVRAQAQVTPLLARPAETDAHAHHH